MTENKRFIFKQDGNFHTVIDTVENKPMGVFEFKENEFPVYACFHKIIDEMNDLNDENQVLKNNVSFLEGFIKSGVQYEYYQNVYEENMELKQQLFETSKELLWATSDEVDRVLYYEDEVEELRKEIFG